MLRKSIPLLAIILVLFLVVGLFAGCQSQSDPTTPPADTPQATPTDTDSPADDPDEPGTGIYPLDSNTTLTYWIPLNWATAPITENIGNLPFRQELERRTGVKVEYIHPARGQETENLNLLIASNELPDIIETRWYDRPGGPEKAIADRTIISLNDVLDNYAPNLRAYLNANPDIDKAVSTDNGNYYVFPFIRGDELLLTSSGPVLRKDWMDELNLAIPETIDEWEVVLKAFRDEKGAEAPFNGQLWRIQQTFAGAFNMSAWWFIDEGQVKYGAALPEYKEFLSTIKRWYDEGLIDSNFATMDDNLYNSNMLTGRSGAAHGSGGGGMGVWLRALQEENPSHDLVGAPYVTAQKGQRPEFGAMENPYSVQGAAAITTSCNDVETAARFLDYAYSEEGHIFYNFGTEDVTYTMVNGEPIYTDEILNHPELAMAQAMALNLMANQDGPFVQNRGYILQFYALEQQRDALNRWVDSNQLAHNMPTATPTEEESAEIARISNDMNTFVSEMQLRFIMGNESLDNFDAYLSELEKIGVHRLIELRQASVDRYLNR